MPEDLSVQEILSSIRTILQEERKEPVFKKPESENVLVLTKEMQVKKTPISKEVVEYPSQVDEYVIQWLDKHLPEIVERIVLQEVRKLFGK